MIKKGIVCLECFCRNYLNKDYLNGILGYILDNMYWYVFLKSKFKILIIIYG